MKRSCTVIFVSVLMLLSGFLTGKIKETGIFVNGGIAFSGYEGIFGEIGMDIGLSRNFYFEILVDYYLEPYGEEVTYNNNITGKGYSFNGVFKFGLTKKFRFITKAGLHLASIKYRRDFVSEIVSRVGFGLGTGIEFRFCRQMGFQSGITFKYVFEQEERFKWYKAYIGFIYYLKPASK